MGRYDGEEYERQMPCGDGAHEFAMNGTCWRCRWSKSELVEMATRILGVLAPERLR